MNKKLIALFVSITLALTTISSVGYAQDIQQPPVGGERTIHVGETTSTYILPAPLDLHLTPPAILQNPPAGARIFPLLRGETAPFNGVLFNGEANAWLETERTSAPQYILQYGASIRAEMTAWTYMELDQLQLQLATEREEGRIRVASLERQIASIQRSSRRSVLRPVLLTGFIVLILGAVGTTTGYIVGRNH